VARVTVGQAIVDVLRGEVIECTPEQERTYTEMYQAAVGWTPAGDGEEIVRVRS
jgi:hypothetical protein